MSTLSDLHRSALLDIADVLIPATDTMPALRDADPTGEWLDRACRARSDLVDGLCLVLDDLAGGDLASVLRSMHADKRSTFDVLATFVAGTYYMVPKIRELIGYPGQLRSPAPLELAADELSDGVFAIAMNYSGTYRRPPA
jgi:hypothetical protein